MIVILLIAVGVLLIVSMVLFIRLRNQKQDVVAYGLRSGDDGDDNTKTNLTEIEMGYDEAMAKLEELGEVKKGKWGGWVWIKNGVDVGKKKT